MSTSTIDPSVPLKGLPRECVESARWVKKVEERVVNGQTIKYESKVAEINGIVVDADTPPSEYRKFLEFFPKESCVVPLTDEDQKYYMATGRIPRVALTFNGVVFTVAKGEITPVPQPLAAMVKHMSTPFRTEEALANRQLLTPLQDATWDF